MISIEKINEQYGREMAVILQACRVYFNTATIEDINNITKNITVNWNEVLAASKRHKIRPVVYKILLQAVLPSDILERIKKELLQITQRNWELACETERLILLLKANGVEAIPYKGTAYSKQFYGDLISRESSDIDLIIEFKDLDTIIELMQHDGYLGENVWVHEFLQEKNFRLNKDFNFNKFQQQKRLFHVEFHWRVAENYCVLNNDANNFLWDTNINNALVKKDLVLLSNEAHGMSIFMHHAFKDCFTLLRNIIDIGVFLQQQQLNWTKIQRRLQQTKCEKSFNLATELADSLFGIKSSYQPNPSLSKAFLKQLIVVNPVNMVEKKPTGFLMRKNQQMRSGVEKFNFLLKFYFTLLLPSIIDFRIVKLPRNFFFLYFFLKPIRFLFVRYNGVEEKKRFIPKE
ncbi:MAG: nucleotidyltransferase family protein [Sphingobacteriia bacterium]|nr:nucleotidyltransferase family protein [Sphingobacteriia bacterium]